MDACPNRRRWERPAPDDDDFRSVASDVDAVSVAGDDVAADPAANVPTTVASVPAADGPPAGSTSEGVAPFNFLAPRPPQAPAALQTATPVVDERFNQLDNLQSQDESPSQSVLSGVVNEACESVTGTDSPVSGMSVSVLFLVCSPKIVTCQRLCLLGNAMCQNSCPLMIPVTGPIRVAANPLVFPVSICHLVSLLLPS